LPEDITDILTAGTPKFLSYFFGIPYEQLYKSVVIKGIINKGFVNPLVYDYVQEVIDALYEEALKELIGLFRDVFERAGYASICVDECCTFTKALTKPIYICFSPWPKDIYVRDAPEDAKAIVLQGLPSQSILQYLQTYDPKGFVWLFVEKGRIAVASNTYRSEAHQELLKILSNNFSIEFIGTTPEKLRESEEVIKTSKALTTAPATQPLTMPRIRRFGSRDVLEDVVASVLDTLGFSIRVDLKIASRSGTEVEVDVLGEKIVGDTRFMVYASCKNWDKPVEVSVVREEVGRISQMLLVPHVRVLVANAFTEHARREAIADGFVVIEIGEKVYEGNIERAYLRVYEKLNRLFTGVAPKWMQDLAEKVRKIADEVKRIGDELEKAGGMFRS
jgi:hypothetical protein